MNEYIDPREKISHEIVAGQLYEDARYENLDDAPDWRIVYVDENRVLLRSNQDLEKADGVDYRYENRANFEEEVGAGRFKLVDDVADAPPMPEENRMREIISLIRRKRDKFGNQGTRTGNHKATAMNELLEELEAFEAEEVDFETVDGIGSGAAENLREAGFHTVLDVQRADRETIESVPLMGKSNTSNLLDHVDK